MDPLIFPTSYPQEGKPFGIALELNLGPLASQVTTLTTRPSRIRVRKLSNFAFYTGVLLSLVVTSLRTLCAVVFCRGKRHRLNDALDLKKWIMTS